MDLATNFTAKAAHTVPSTIQQFSAGDWFVTAVALFFILLKATDGKLHHIPNPKFDLWFSYPQEGQSKASAVQKRTRNISTRMTESV
jgi:hypothetical protein